MYGLSLFLNSIVGRQSRYTSSDIQGYMRDVIIARLNDLLGEQLEQGAGQPAVAALGEAPGDRQAALSRPLRQTYVDGDAPRVVRGGELASFGLGSTVVLLYERRLATLCNVLGPVRVGEEIARRRPAGEGA